MSGLPDYGSSLRTPAEYFPLHDGKYDVGPALEALGRDYGNGDADQKIFQIDNRFFEYRQVKLDARRERLSKYYRTHMLPSGVLQRIARFIIERVTLEHPDIFSIQSHSDDEFVLDCKLTGETLRFDRQLHFLGVEGNNRKPKPDYHDALDALACQVQEDFAIVCKSAFDRDWLGAIHLCMANRWAAEDKIGQPFQQVHKPVAGMQNDTRVSAALVNAMIHKGPFVRFAWGLTTDSSLNLHPRSQLGRAATMQPARRFDPQSPSLHMRIERQTLWPFPEQLASLFTIRTYVKDCEEIRSDEHKNSQLVANINSMTEQQLRYKGLDRDREQILGWLVRGELASSPSRDLSIAINRMLQA
jgi:hypothetical protein